MYEYCDERWKADTLGGAPGAHEFRGYGIFLRSPIPWRMRGRGSARLELTGGSKSPIEGIGTYPPSAIATNGIAGQSHP